MKFKTIRFSPLELQVVELALLQLRVSTKTAIEQNGKKATDEAMYNLIAKVELMVLEAPQDKPTKSFTHANYEDR